MSDELLRKAAEWMKAVERAGLWHPQAAVPIVHFVPKEFGGRRPIGILPSAIRLWERVRTQAIQDWKLPVDRAYKWMAPGRGAVDPFRRKPSTRRPPGGGGRRLHWWVKAFEQVVLSQVWEKGVKHCMPRRILVLTLEACSFGKRLSFRGCVSNEAQTLTGILARSEFATDLLLVSLVDGVDGILQRNARNAIGCGEGHSGHRR